jgi:hypothetical protein
MFHEPPEYLQNSYSIVGAPAGGFAVHVTVVPGAIVPVTEAVKLASPVVNAETVVGVLDRPEVLYAETEKLYQRPRVRPVTVAVVVVLPTVMVLAVPPDCSTYVSRYPARSGSVLAFQARRKLLWANAVVGIAKESRKASPANLRRGRTTCIRPGSAMGVPQSTQMARSDKRLSR